LAPGTKADHQGRYTETNADTTKDNNPTAHGGKTGTIYGVENRCTALANNETRVAEGRCRACNNQRNMSG